MPFSESTVFWVKAHVSFDDLGSLHGKVAFGEGRDVACSLVPAEQPGWFFSSREHADNLAEYAAGRLAKDLAGLCAPATIITEVCEA